MELINPNEIGAKISTLIAEAETQCIIVSPYLGIHDWKKVKVNLERAVNRGVEVKVYYREINENDAKLLAQFGIEPIRIDGLHTKLYLNDHEAIVTSMNLYESSDLHSKDLALHYRDEVSYDKLRDYYDRYIACYWGPVFPTCKTLIELYDCLKRVYSEHKFGRSLSYIYSKSLVPGYHLFIKLDEIGIKNPKRDLSPQGAEIATEMLKMNVSLPVTLRKPMEGYRYTVWDVPIAHGNVAEIMKLIQDLQALD